MAAGSGAVALEAGIAADLTGAGSCEVRDVSGATDAAGAAAAVGEATGLVAVGLCGVAVTAGGAWPSDGAGDRGGLLALGLPALGLLALAGGVG